MGAGDIQKFEAAYVKEVQVAEIIEKTHSLAVRLLCCRGCALMLKRRYIWSCVRYVSKIVDILVRVLKYKC